MSVILSLWVYVMVVPWRVSGVYLLVIGEAVLVGFTALITALMVQSIAGGTANEKVVILIAGGYLLIRYVITIILVHNINVTKTLLKTYVHTDVVKSEWTKNTVLGETLAKLGMSSSIPAAILDDIPDIITTVVTLLALTASMFTLGWLPMGILVAVISIGGIITLVKTRYVGKLHANLYTIESRRVVMLESRDSTVLQAWVGDRQALLMKFWWADTAQGVLQAPVVIAGLVLTLLCIDLTPVTLVLVLGVYATVYHQIEKFAQIQESLTHLALTLSKLKSS